MTAMVSAMINIHKTIFLFSIFFFLTLMINVEWSQASSTTLMINPIRVVFEGRHRTAKVNVANPNPVPVRYRISLVNMHNNNAENMAATKNVNEWNAFIKSMIRFSPRQATIDPGTRQVVKLMVRKPPDLPQGEYQIRLQFMPLAEPVDVEKSENGTGSGKKQFNVDLIVGVTIPIIIQHGKINTEIKPVNLVLIEYPQVPSGLAADITLSRSGDYSAFGDVVVKHFDAADGNNQIVGEGKGIGVYFPDTHRKFTLPLQDLEKIDLKSGKLRVEFHHKFQGKHTPVISYKDFHISP